MTVRRTSNHLPGRSLLVLAVGAFAVNLDAFVLAGLLPAVARDLRVDLGTAGQLTSLFALTYAVASPLLAAVTGRLDRRVVLGAGAGVFALGLVVQAAGPGFAVVALGRVVAAVGAAGYQATAYSSAGLLAEPERRARALATVLAGGTVALVLGVPLGVGLGSLVGWRGASLMIGGAGLLAAALVPLLPALHAPTVGLRERFAVALDRRVLAVLTTTVLVLAPGYLLVLYLAPVVGAHPTWLVSAAMLTVGLGQLGSNRVVGALVDRHGPMPALTAGCLVLAAAALGLAGGAGTGGTARIVALLAGALGAGVGIGLLITPQQVRYFGIDPRTAPVAIGLNGSAIQLGATAGGAIGGAAAAHVVAVPLVAAALALLAAGLLRPLTATGRAARPAGLPRVTDQVIQAGEQRPGDGHPAGRS